MKGADRRVDKILNELLEKPLPREERKKLLKELVRRGEELPDAMLEEALRRLMERLTE